MGVGQCTYVGTLPISSSLAISGRISSSTTSEISGVTVTLAGPGTSTATSDSSGNYSFAGLASGTYTVTPSKSSVSFVPQNRVYSNLTTSVTDADFNIPVPIEQCTSPEPETNFGDILFGTTEERVLNFTNNSGSPLTPTDFTLEGDADYFIRNNTCFNSLLNPGQSCSWTARFTAAAGGMRKSRV